MKGKKRDAGKSNVIAKQASTMEPIAYSQLEGAKATPVKTEAKTQILL
jgi:hypothetical protein